MEQLRQRSHPQTPPAIATDGNGSYRQAMLQNWGQVPQYKGRGRPPSRQQPGAGWQYLQVVKHRRDNELQKLLFKLFMGFQSKCRRSWVHILLMLNVLT